ncbi:MAG: phage holin family protein [Rhizobiaceae bacterium]|nr:phage holin family protein [Rhizobiaceae bacterium]
MVRLFAFTILELAANAVGLLVAAWLLPNFRMDVIGFVLVVALFTLAKFILGPLMFKLSFKYVRALNGGVALVTTFVGLLVTSWLTDHLAISGVSTWVLSTLIVWLCGVIAAIVLPIFLFKKALSGPSNGRPLPPIV